MSTQVIDTPGGIAFSGFYYPEILRELLSFLRQNKERIGLTDENDFEVHVQLLRAFALVGHLNNTRLDSVATEMLLDSAQLLESVKRLLRLVGVELRSASPASAELVAKLSEVTTADKTDFIPGLAEFSTDSVPPIIYEADKDGLGLDRTDQVKYVYGLETTDSGAAGEVSSATGDILRRTTGSWGTGVNSPVGDHVFIVGSLFDNGGEFRVTERLSAADVKVVRIPDSKSPGFQTETGLTWTLRRFTTNHATAANTGASFFSPWTSSVAIGDSLYVGHRHVMPTQLDFTFQTSAANITGVWEYFDNTRSLFNPKSVTDLGSTLRFNLEPLLGTLDRSGAEVTVTYLKTGAKETLTSVWAGGENRITTSGLLGQLTASTSIDDYHVTADWVPFDNAEDKTIDTGTGSFEKAGEAKWDLPQTLDRGWLQTDVNAVEAYWSRFRIVSLGVVTAPSFDLVELHKGDQHYSITVLQGETVGPQIIGSSTGQAGQEHKLPETPYIDDSETTEVDESGSGNWVEYTRVQTFLNSSATSRHYVREVDATDTAKVRFGDGANGKIPPAGVGNIRATYRVGGDDDGNAGADQITVNAEGVAGIGSVTNPRSATGWRIKDGGDDGDLARVKRDSPASLRVRGTASTADDVRRLAIDEFVDSTGQKPVARAWAEEEGFGVKTIKLLVVGTGGTTLSATQLSDLELYFNGDRFARPPVKGVIVMNHKVTAVNFEPALINVEATVVWKGGSAERIRNTLLAFLTPLAFEDDGTTYIWDFASQVSYSRVHSLIHEVDPNIKDVPVLRLNSVADSYDLGTNELPVTTAASLTINIQEA